MAAYNACVADCGGSVFDYDESEYLNNTDPSSTSRAASVSKAPISGSSGRSGKSNPYTTTAFLHENVEAASLRQSVSALRSDS